MMEPNKTVYIDYTNWRGERRWRKITPIEMYWANASEFHTCPQWVIVAHDEETPDRKVKHFVFLGVHAVSKEPSPVTINQSNIVIDASKMPFEMQRTKVLSLEFPYDGNSVNLKLLHSSGQILPYTVSADASLVIKYWFGLVGSNVTISELARWFVMQTQQKGEVYAALHGIGLGTSSMRVNKAEFMIKEK